MSVKFRSGKQIIGQLQLELAILKVEWIWVLIAAIYEYVSLVSHNMAYYLHQQGPALRDLGFELLPRATGFARKLPDILVFVMFGVLALAFVTFLVLDPKYFQSSEIFGRKPRRVYLIIVARRILAVLAVAFLLRAMSFLSTLLPGADAHCAPIYDEQCIALTPGCNGRGVGSCMIPNPDYDPPKDFTTLLFGFSVTSGCGDLVFSQHLSYQLVIAMALWKYFGYGVAGKVLRAYLVIHIAVFSFFDVAARLHYTNDIITALYVNPMLWFLFEAYWPDPDSYAIYRFSAEKVALVYGKGESEILAESAWSGNVPPPANFPDSSTSASAAVPPTAIATPSPEGNFKDDVVAP